MIALAFNSRWRRAKIRLAVIQATTAKSSPPRGLPVFTLPTTAKKAPIIKRASSPTLKMPDWLEKIPPIVAKRIGVAIRNVAANKVSVKILPRFKLPIL
jgi:hypothetical protein